jgi:hypothetical protein
MAVDPSLCAFIEKIRQDPLQKISGLTISQFYALQEHVLECETCWKTINEIAGKYKDEPNNSDSEWDKTRYN